MVKNSMSFENIVSIATENASFMTGNKQGIIDLLIADTSYSPFLPLHSIIHRKHLAAKYFKFPHVMQVVLKILSYIH